MKLNFKKYIEQEEKKAYLTEANQPSLRQLIDNFGKVFPYSDDDLPIVSSKINGWDTTNMNIVGTVKSEDGSGNYNCKVDFHRDSSETLWSIEMVGKVYCSCPAFKYNTAYPDAKNGVLSMPVDGAEKIANKVRNPGQIPSVCKHLYSFLHKFYESKLKNQKPIEQKEEEQKPVDNTEVNNEDSEENAQEQGHPSTV